MNKDWSDKNKEMQKLISKETTFKKGVELLIELRKDIFGQITHIAMDYPEEAFSQMPFGGETETTMPRLPFPSGTHSESRT